MIANCLNKQFAVDIVLYHTGAFSTAASSLCIYFKLYDARA